LHAAGRIDADSDLLDQIFRHVVVEGRPDHRGHLLCAERRRGKARSAGCDDHLAKHYGPPRCWLRSDRMSSVSAVKKAIDEDSVFDWPLIRLLTANSRLKHRG
jgi:hypothetical protein